METPWLGGKRLSSTALDALRSYAFPGNVRELKNVIERAAYRDTTDEITPDDLGLRSASMPATNGDSFTRQMDAFGRELIAQSLRLAGGNGAQAARDLGLSYHQFRYYLKKYAVATGDG